MGYCHSLQHLSVCPSIHLSIQLLLALLTSNHQCIFTMPSTCTSHYYFGSPTFDLGTVTFTLTLLVTTKLPERNITSMPKWYICCILPLSQTSLKGSDLGWTWPTFQGQIGHHDVELFLLVQYCLNKTSHQCQNCIFGEFYQYLEWFLTFDLLFKVR